jgi:hypothetical protein
MFCTYQSQHLGTPIPLIRGSADLYGHDYPMSTWGDDPQVCVGADQQDDNTESVANRDEQTEQLEILLDAALQSFAAWLAVAGYPATRSEQRTSITPTGNGELVTIEAPTAWMHLGSWQFGLAGTWTAEALALAEGLALEANEHLPFWSSGSSNASQQTLGLDAFHGDFYDNPGRWILERVLLPATFNYIGGIADVRSPDIALRGVIAASMITLLWSDHLTVVTKIGVAGLITDADVVTAGHLKVRELTAIEKGNVREEGQGRETRGMGLGRHVPRNVPLTHLIEIRARYPRMPQPYFDVDRPTWSTKGALFLNGFGLAGTGTAMSELEPVFVGLRAGGPVALANVARNPRLLDDATLTDVAADAERLSVIWAPVPRSPSELAIHRFILGCTRDQDVDALVDFVVCLEAILLPDDPESRRSDLSYRFRLHGAYFIAETPGRLRPIWRDLRDLYNSRSRLVHGGGFPDPREIGRETLIARRLAARAVRKGLREGFPDSNYFNSAMLRELDLWEEESL